MNIERQEAPMTVSYSRGDALSEMLPSIMKGKGGLSGVPQATLRQNLQPVIHALKNLNAELLLDLQPAEQGPRVAEG